LRLLLGNNPLFHVPQYELVNPWEFAIYAALGVAGGVVSVAFTKLLLGLRARFLKFPRKTLPFQPVVGGVIVGIMGWFVPQVLGVGYDHVGTALNGGLALKLMLLLLALKLVAVATCYASGNAGGIFGPSLFLGAMLGGAVGAIAHNFFPTHVATQGAYALVGMGTAFAGIVRAPMTSVVMIFEITRDYAVIVPLMISNLISFFISSRLQRQPIYEALARQDGIHLPSAEARELESNRRVALVLRPATVIFDAATPVRSALETATSSDTNAWPVVDGPKLLGILTLENLKQAASAGPDERPLRDLLRGADFPHLHSDHPLSTALERMGAHRLNVLPVVNRADVHKLEGIVMLRDVLSAYGISPNDK
jgi:CIC family chloride channel protein